MKPRKPLPPCTRCGGVVERTGLRGRPPRRCAACRVPKRPSAVGQLHDTDPARWAWHAWLTMWDSEITRCPACADWRYRASYLRCQGCGAPSLVDQLAPIRPAAGERVA